MALPLVATKLYVPALRRELVARPRLLARLDAARDARLVLVSAPAGFGKTTLVATWLSSTTGEEAVAWLSLDATDTDPTHTDPTACEGTDVDSTQAPAPEPGDLVIDAALRNLAEAPEDDLDAQVERGEQVQRTLQGRLSDLGG